MDNTGLIFIPDISGFTKFVNETEIEHSRFIIEELLETIINSNQLDLSISEIEGDAVLFYKFGDPPSVQQLVHQVEKMFCEFHKQILNYERRRLCQCLACKNAADLSLKVVIHYGEFSSYKVKEFSKLLGRDIIVAHQLLKNDIDLHEYILVTDRIPAKEELREMPSWVNWNTGKKITDAGEVPFNYSLLTPLKKSIAPDPLPELEPADQIKMVSASREYNIEIIELLAVIGRFSQRAAWEDGVRQIDQVTDKIPQLGTRHRCVLDNKSVIVQYSNFSYEPGKIVVSETDERKKGSTYYTFEKIADGKTRLTLEYFIPKSPFGQILFNLTRKDKVFNSFQNSLANLEKHIQKPGVGYRA
jgi:Protein of unknown function (DUF2652)